MSESESENELDEETRELFRSHNENWLNESIAYQTRMDNMPIITFVLGIILGVTIGISL